MPCVSLQRKTSNFQENPSDLDAQLLELVVGFICQPLKNFLRNFLYILLKVTFKNSLVPMLLEKIKSPADVKALDIKSLEQLAAEMRTALLKKLSKRGGHVAPNLGFVEGTIALHYVFDSPKDKIVYDVSHQSYSHKMLTGRAQAFLD